MKDKFKDLIENKLEKCFQKVNDKVSSNSRKGKHTKDKENTDIKDITLVDVGNKVDGEILNIYNKIKNGEIDANTIEDDILYKVIFMLNEELSQNTRILEDKIRITNINISNLKIANSSAQLLKKN